MKVLGFADRLIRYSFYLLFLLVPLAFTNNTSELFEFNKMWATFALTIIITAAWITKMTAQKRFYLQRTPLDIPIALFLLSQIISTIFSLDPHTSLWGYYTRFNGGLLSIVSYILLYYAFVSNLLEIRMVKRLLITGLISGVIVALWGLPSHFGYDPTCLLFRGNFDVSCWTIDFQPKLRIFSTLGQPNWLAAYLAILTPIALAMGISNFKFPRLAEDGESRRAISKNNLVASGYLLASFLFTIDLLFTKSQSGFLGIAAALLIFIGVPIFQQARREKKLSNVLKSTEVKILLASLLIFIVTVFFVGSPIEKLNTLSFQGLQDKFANKKIEKTTAPSSVPALELNITGSGEIRSIVWKGAFDIWKHYPVFGSGVETFAYSYYKYRPVEHNQTSEWNFLYNKAHNEYLNFLATTGIVGFATYTFMIAYFLYLTFKKFLRKKDLDETWKLITLSLLAGYVSILVTNFFGFSVVVINIYFYLIPAFVFIALDMINPKRVFEYPKSKEVSSSSALFQKIAIGAITLLALYLLLQLFRYWTADKAYSLGSNLDRSQQFQAAYPYLIQAIAQRGDEPVFQDEFSVNNAVLASSLISFAQTKPASESAQDAPVIEALIQSAIQTSDKITKEHPNNVIFWKSRVRIFYTLSQVDPQYFAPAIAAIKIAQSLAPTDATISYNLGILQGQNGDFDGAIKTLENTIKLRPPFRDAHFGLALFYHQKAVDKNGKVIDGDLQQKAIDRMKYILEKLDPTDAQAQEALKTWNAE